MRDPGSQGYVAHKQTNYASDCVAVLSNFSKVTGAKNCAPSGPLCTAAALSVEPTKTDSTSSGLFQTPCPSQPLHHLSAQRESSPGSHPTRNQSGVKARAAATSEHSSHTVCLRPRVPSSTADTPKAPGSVNCENAILFGAGGNSASLSFLLNNYELGDHPPKSKRFCQHRRKILKRTKEEVKVFISLQLATSDLSPKDTRSPRTLDQNQGKR